MLKLITDEDLDRRVVRGLLRYRGDLDIVRVQDVGLSGASDATVLEWAAGQGRVLLTHDAKTMTRYAYERIKAGQAVAGVFVLRRGTPIGTVVDELLLLVEASLAGEWEGQVRYIPF